MSNRTIILLVVLGALVLTPVAVKLVETASEKRKLDALVPGVRTAVETIRARLAARGIKTIVGSTRRTDTEQAALVAKGSSATNNSWHELGRAIDLYPVGAAGGIAKESEVDLYRAMVEEARKLGGESLAFNSDGTKRYITTSAGKVWDAGHLQFRDGMTFAQAQAAARKAVV